MMAVRRRPVDLDALVAGVSAGERAVLGRALTLVESSRPDHRRAAEELLKRVQPRSGAAHRVGVTGVPGAGKSTFIETLGMALVERGHRVAVLAVDPSSTVSGGSILGDKTRMAGLAVHPRAFVRPSASGGTLGGVARKTREAMIVCEAAGYDVVLVETVGVGQSETLVADMVDFFLVLALAGAGDELQGVKRGLLELAHCIVVNKADGANRRAAERARLEHERARDFMRPVEPGWDLKALAISSLDPAGPLAVWDEVVRHRAALEHTGDLVERRRRQSVRWVWSLVQEEMMTALRRHPETPGVEADVRAGRLTPGVAARKLLGNFSISDDS